MKRKYDRKTAKIMRNLQKSAKREERRATGKSTPRDKQIHARMVAEIDDFFGIVR